MTEYNIKTKTYGKCRVYPDSPNGLQPSVTSICGVLMKYGLIDWAANCAVDYIDRELNDWIDSDQKQGFMMDKVMAEARQAHNIKKDEAADTGTNVHELCQLWLEKDGLLNEKMAQASDNERQMLESFIGWAEKNKIEPVHVEIKLHGDGYSGRCDLIAYRTDPKTGERVLGLYDIKTTPAYYPEQGLQLAAYAEAYLCSDDDFTEDYVEEIGIIRLDKKSLRCNFSESGRGPKFTEHRDRLTKAFMLLKDFYWLYNQLEAQFKEIDNEDS